MGKTPRRHPRQRSSAVHPHGCGENFPHSFHFEISSGSSPRVWGKHRCRSTAVRTRRFIPTGVGKTGSNPRNPRLTPVHPHGCGENAGADFAQGGDPGSSPRVWGKRLDDPPHAGGHRFIPTGVGKTAPAWRRQTRAPVHPHGCGENTPALSSGPGSGGSSPRVWGKRHLPQLQ